MDLIETEQITQNTDINTLEAEQITQNNRLTSLENNFPISLDDLNDVIINTPTTNQIMWYNGTNWINESVIISGIDKINDALDFDGTILKNEGDLMAWDAVA